MRPANKPVAAPKEIRKLSVCGGSTEKGGRGGRGELSPTEAKTFGSLGRAIPFKQNRKRQWSRLGNYFRPRRGKKGESPGGKEKKKS